MKFENAFLLLTTIGNSLLVLEVEANKKFRQRANRVLRTKGAKGDDDDDGGEKIKAARGDDDDDGEKIEDGGLTDDGPVADGGVADDDLSNDFDDGISNDSSHLELICGIFKEYSDLAAAGSNDVINFCDPFQLDSYLLCPNYYENTKICDGMATGVNVSQAIEKNYCIPLFDEMYENPDLMDDCVEYCVSYVSVEEGNCCDVECA
jgi:hypothetical protein